MGLVIYSEGKGTVLFIPRGNNGPTVHISDVLFVPELGCNLFSPLHLTQHRGFTVTIIKDLISFTKDSVAHFYAKVCNSNIAILDGTVQVQQIATVSQELVDRSLLHRRLGHISKDRLEQLLRNKLVVNLKLGSDSPMSDLCEACILGKQHRSPFPQQAENRHSNPLDLIHSDVHGPLPTQTIQGFRYWITFLDDATKYYHVVLLKKKSKAFKAFLTYEAYAENLLQRKIGH